MEEEKKKAYSEVVEVLKLIENEQKIEQIPFEVIQLIKANSDPEYRPNISKEVPLEEQNLRDETFRILGWIASKYWGEDVGATITNNEIETVKEETNIEANKMEENTEANTEKEEKVLVYNDIEPECLEGSNLPVVVSELTWYQKIKATVIRILKTIFRIKNKEEEGVKE